jgi:uncharacterized protein involved in cysteine biosynthesis
MIKFLLQLPVYFRQLLEVVPLHVEGNQFIKDNKLWNGLFKLKWVLWSSIGFGLLISFLFISTFFKWVVELSSGLFESASQSSVMSISSSMQFFSEGLHFNGGLKYMILIFAEVIIFHCVINTINILSGNNRKPKFKDFIEAEKRMIKVSLTAWILELIVGIFVKIFFSIIGFSFLQGGVLLVIQFYFIGHLFLDNYNEQYGLSIKESFNVIKGHAGAAVGIGFIAYILFLIPIVGIIVAPILGAVTGALYMYSHEVNSHLERQFELV